MVARAVAAYSIPARGDVMWYYITAYGKAAVFLAIPPSRD